MCGALTQSKSQKSQFIFISEYPNRRIKHIFGPSGISTWPMIQHNNSPRFFSQFGKLQQSAKSWFFFRLQNLFRSTGNWILCGKMVKYLIFERRIPELRSFKSFGEIRQNQAMSNIVVLCPLHLKIQEVNEWHLCFQVMFSFIENYPFHCRHSSIDFCHPLTGYES